MLKVCPLASGSKGNAIFLATEQSKILIDCGISGRALTAKLHEIDVEVSEIDAILISHEHGDHIKGLKIFAYKHGIPVLSNSDTAKGIVNAFGDCPKFKIFSTGESFEFRDLQIHPFSIPHDTADPVAFTVTAEDKKGGFCTDLGFATQLVKSRLRGCDYLYVEANHQPALVQASARPHLYKQRVLSRSGHLSNIACGDLIREIYTPQLKHVYLAHLSSDCNREELALEEVKGQIGESASAINFSIAYQDRISDLLSL